MIGSIITPATALSATLAATSATFACPTADDLDIGVRVSSTAGESETFRRLSDGNTVSRFREPDFPPSEAVLINGFFPVTIYDIKEGRPDLDTLAQFVYDPESVPLPVPSANSKWSGTVTYVEDNRGTREAHSYAFGARTNIRLGDCQYAVIPVTGRFGPQPDNQEKYHYLTDLGIAYVVESGAGADKLTYRYSRIEAVAN